MRLVRNIQGTTGINNVKVKAKSFSFYPNPVSDKLVIEKNSNNEKLKFELINAMGQTVYKGYFSEKTIVETTNFSPGVYLIRIESGNTVELDKLIIK